MEVKFENLKIKSTYYGNKQCNWDCKVRNYNNHVIRVTNLDTKKWTSFDYWGSVINPELSTEDDLLYAFEHIIQDAVCGTMYFEDFCSEFGYDTDSRRAYKTHCACIKSKEKLERVCGDVNDLQSRFLDRNVVYCCICEDEIGVVTENNEVYCETCYMLK